jgi:transcription-repair coupling factor (superfamily II helicase)
MIETPPENRFPVQTYVMEWNPELVREAIQRELERQGQVFVVHNRIAALPILADQLEQLVPQGRFVIAHGQMPEGKLAETMSDFLSGEYDVLISTTIIEAGIDMPNVNTLIVCDADRYGLSQLHQLRGRIGRSSRIGYAYFMYTRDKQLSELSEKRLIALKEFCQLGEGYKIALRDLEMRGVGNLLGAEQHGNVAAVGFELYSMMLKEAVENLKGVVQVKKVETVLELQVDAFIPSEYINDVGHKVDFYRRIQQADLEELIELQDELIDRFGDIPLQVRNLLQIAQLRLKASLAGIKLISQKPGEVVAIRVEGVSYSLNDAALLVMAMDGRLRHQAGKSTPFLIDVSGLSASAMLQQIEIFVAGFQRIAKS